MTQRDQDYIIWQNRALRFYLAARNLYHASLFAPAAYCAHQALELIMKATLHYWDRSFNPRDAGHNLRKMTRMINNKARPSPPFTIPPYFSHEQRFLTATRYPSTGHGVVVPSTLIVDLDRLFETLVCLVPFQFNSELTRAVRGRDRPALLVLRRHNPMLRRLRRFLRAR